MADRDGRKDGNGPDGKGALANIKVLDLTDERGIYGVKLLADLGADVIRPEPPSGDPLRTRGPLANGSLAAGEQESLWYSFFASNRRFVSLDLAADAGRQRLHSLIERADIVVTCKDAFGVAEANLLAARDVRPELVVIDVTSFGDTGPWCEYLAPDLIAGALGGAVATTGDADTEPLKLFGEQNFMVSGAYVAIAALSALLHQRAVGQGQRVGVSVHECIASCLEHVLMWSWYADKLPSAQSRVLPRRGSLHWSNAYQVMPAESGSIMITPAPDFESQIFWLVEEDEQQDLIDPKYLEPENAPLMIARLMDVLRGWVAKKDAEELFFAAQERHMPYGWVLPVEKLATNPQLEARGWWTSYRVAGELLRGPGAPYRFSETPWAIDASEAGREVTQIDWLTDAATNTATTNTTERASARNSGDNRPLAGIRVLDFTHVLAGPFATRILADMGADVVKVNSEQRAVATNDPNHPYYVMWNRNKRALALNMGDTRSREIARSLADQADIVIDNFSVGVLDRWGLGYDEVSTTNPGVSYVQMSGMGEGGPWSGFVTYAPTIHALAGLTQVTGVPGREDIGAGFSYNDHQAGLHGTVAMLAVLAARQRTGRGQRVDLSQFETGVNFLGPALLDWFANDNATRPTGNDLPYDAVAPHGVYACAADGQVESPTTEQERWVAIACMTDAQWLALRNEMGNPAWAMAPNFDTAAGRIAERETLDAELTKWTRAQEAGAVMQRCQAAGVPAGVVQTGEDLVDTDPQLRGRDFSQPIADLLPEFGQTYADRLPIDFSLTPCSSYTRVRKVGEDNASVMADWLNVSTAEVHELESGGQLR